MASSAASHRPHLPDFILTDKLGSGTYATVYKAYRKARWYHLVAELVYLNSSSESPSVSTFPSLLVLVLFVYMWVTAHYSARPV